MLVIFDCDGVLVDSEALACQVDADLLTELGIDVAIREEPFGVPITTPFARDTTHASWDREAIARFGRILDWTPMEAPARRRRGIGLGQKDPLRTCSRS